MNSSQARRKKARQRRQRNRILFVLAVLLLVVVIVVATFTGNGKEGNASSEVSSVPSGVIEIPSNSTVSSEVSKVESTVPSEVSKVESTVSKNNSSTSSPNIEDDIKITDTNVAWNLILVNPKNKLPSSFKVATSKVTAKYTTGDRDYYFDSRAIDDLHAMCQAALDDGVRLSICSTYRTYDYQKNLYEKRVKRCMNEEGLSEAAARVKAATIVAIAGTSEHNLGLAVDFYPVTEQFEKTEQYKWLNKHAEEYGFIMRYPTSKKEITGIIYEPWHYRYVGKDVALEMKSKGICFEEYCESLKN